MDKATAISLINDVFQNSFNREHFIAFTKNLFNFLDTEKNFVYRGNLIPDAYQPFIHTLERIGKYKDAEDNKIDVLIVHLKKEHSIEHARAMQRNFVAWYLGGSRGGELKDAALVAFHTDNLDDWRFSLVKMDYQIIESETGKIKTKTELTPARRFSFLVGKNENSHTAQKQLLPILQDDKNNPLLSDLEKAFNIEVVTQEFFEKYCDLFLDVKESLEQIIKKDQAISQDFAGKGVNPVDFAKKLLGQIVFLYFLQKKGWFGVGRDDNWGTGPKNFLRLLFEKMIADYKNFFNDILEPLFYEALAKERDKDFYSRFNCKIPFLNGGLFDPISDYDWVHTDILLPDDLFSNHVKTKEGDIGTGILDIFDRYNFTVKEDEPLEKEVAVDPEMLGKVFENLLEVKDRKSKGTYYTPREIVHYMCQESLINYLVNECEGKVDRKDIETLIQYGEIAVEHDSRVEREGKETETYSYKLPESVRKNAQLIDDKLKNIRVCDPAIGSGAFPVGMMNEIIRTRNTLTNYLEDKADRSMYSFKRNAIQNSLYGVDIDPGAVEIAKLRLWLSLVVDEEDIKQIKPLPNLDYKIVCGNSLLSVNKQNLFVDYNLKQIEKLKEELFNETNIRKKQEYKEQIDKLIAEVTDNNKSFDFEIYFSEVFEDEKEENNGFDVVIANPPYIGERGHKEIFREIRKGALVNFYLRKMDIFYFFFHLALNLGKQNSSIAFITTNYYITASGAKKLRQDFQSRTSIRNLINFNELKLFESAQGQHNMITILSKSDNNSEYKNVDSYNCITKRSGFAKPDVLHQILSWHDQETEYFDVPQKDLYDGSEMYIRLNGKYNNSNSYIQTILDKMMANYSLGQICFVNMGVQSGADIVGRKLLDRALNLGYINKKYLEENNISIGTPIYIVDQTFVNGLLPKERDIIKPFIKNSDVDRYYIPSKFQHYYIYADSQADIQDMPSIKKHLLQFRPILKAREQVNDKNNSWFWIRGSKRQFLIDTGEHIVCPYRAKLNIFALTDGNIVGAGDVYFITKKDKSILLRYILALLNSKLFYVWLYYKGKRKGEILELYQKPLSEIPIKKISEDEQKPFIEIVDKILAITSSSDYLTISEKRARVQDYEKQIDKLVYKLYDLSPDEIAVVEKAS